MIHEKIHTQNNPADLKNLENSHLSIQLSLNGLVYCIFDKDEVDVVFLKEYVFEKRAHLPTQLFEYVEEIFNKDNLLSEKFESVSLAQKNNLATIVPTALHKKKYNKDYLKYTVKVLENDRIDEDMIAENDVKNVYISFEQVMSFLSEKYTNISFLHNASLLISNLLNYHKHNPNKLFFVNVAQDTLDIVYLDKNKLQLYNSFLYYSKEDFLYYILFVMEQLMLNPDEQAITFMGDIDKVDSLYAISYKYIRNIEFLQVKNFSLSEEFYHKNTQIKEHYYFELLNQF